MSRRCIICAADIETGRANRKTCSDECRRQRIRDVVEANRSAYPEKRKVLEAAYRKRRRKMIRKNHKRWRDINRLHVRAKANERYHKHIIVERARGRARMKQTRLMAKAAIEFLKQEVSNAEH